MTPRQLILHVILPAGLFALMIAIMGWRPWRRGDFAGGFKGGAWAGPAAIAGGMAVGLFAPMTARPPFPPTDATDWFYWLAPAVLLAGLLAALVRKPPIATSPILRMPLAILLIAAALLLVLRPLFRGLSPVPAAVWLGEMAIPATAAAFLLDRLAVRAPGASVPLLMWVTASAMTIVLMDASMKLGQFAAALAAAAGGVLVVAFVCRQLSVARGGAIAFVLLASTLIAAGVYWADVAVKDAWLLAAVPLIAWLPEVLPQWFNPLKPGWPRTLMRFVLIAAPLLIAAWPHGVSLYKTMQSDSGLGSGEE